MTLYAPDWKARRDRRREVRELEARYSDSLLRSAYALQARFWNLVNGRFSDVYVRGGTDEERFHAVTSTVWLVGQYFCWVELLRRDAYSLALGGVERGQQLLRLLARVEELFATDRFPPRFRLWRAQQSALGELMIVQPAVNNGRPDCIGYATFVENLDRQQFKRWFAPLEDALQGPWRDPERERLAHLQNALVELVEFLNRGQVSGLERLDPHGFHRS